MTYGLLPTMEDKATLGSDLSASWDFAGSICSLYLKLSPPNRGRQFVFCQPQLDKIQCLPLTKYAHFWMTELVGDDTVLLRYAENLPYSSTFGTRQD